MLLHHNGLDDVGQREGDLQDFDFTVGVQGYYATFWQKRPQQLQRCHPPPPLPMTSQPEQLARAAGDSQHHRVVGRH
eukprot:481078-Pleurochrysis_carterae.AAC.5